MHYFSLVHAQSFSIKFCHDKTRSLVRHVCQLSCCKKDDWPLVRRGGISVIQASSGGTDFSISKFFQWLVSPHMTSVQPAVCSACVCVCHPAPGHHKD